MTYSTILTRRGLGFPIVTFTLVLGCLVISLPILFETNIYDLFALWSEDPRPWQSVTHQFCHGEHGGANFWPHLITNLSFIVLFGGVIERLLGSGRFFTLTMAGFFTNLIRISFLTNNVSNGASGYCWGYVVFAVPVLIWIWRRQKWRALRDVFFVLATVTAVFGIFGLALIIWIRDSSLINNTNIAHLVSILTAVPFFLAWRKLLFANLTGIETRNRMLEPHNQSTWDKTAVGLAALLLFFNVAMAVSAMTGLIS